MTALTAEIEPGLDSSVDGEGDGACQPLRDRKFG
jgi:hypothetical protein